jgi:hypothetical protein
MNLYLDESGDLGFNFDKPYRYGGSSRHLTIAFLLLPKELSHLPKRIIKKLYQRKKQPTSRELKGPELTSKDRLFLANKIFTLLTDHPSIEAFAITVYKKTTCNNPPVYSSWFHISRVLRTTVVISNSCL